MTYTLLFPLLATILIEWGVLWFLGERRRRVLWSSVVVNILTNVPLNIILRHMDGGWTAIAVGEVAVVIVETLWYVCFVRQWHRAFVYSLLCNAISFLTGLLIQLLCLLLRVPFF